MGGSLDARATNEGTTASCAALSKDAPLCLDLLADIVLRPSFPEDEMAEVRDQMLAKIAARFDSPHELAMAHFDNLLFGEKNPEGWVLTAEDVKQDHPRAAGDVLEDVLPPEPRHPRGRGRRRRREAARRHRQGVRRLGARRGPGAAGLDGAPGDGDAHPAGRPRGSDPGDDGARPQGIKHADPRWYAATLVNYVLGGSDFSSRLMIEVRSKRGLTYGIGSSFGASLYQGAFRVTASTKNETAWEALLATVNEIRRMKTDGPTTGELDKAKGYYAGSYPFKLQTAAGVAQALVAAELHGLGAAYVRELPRAAGGRRRGRGQGGGGRAPAARHDAGRDRRQGGGDRAADRRQGDRLRAHRLQGPDQRRGARRRPRPSSRR